jgi:hypothetical protein
MKQNLARAIPAWIGALAACGTPALGQPAAQPPLAESRAPAPVRCLPAQHWDSGMRMCMPGAEPAKAAAAPASPAPASARCPPVQHWDPGMGMCVSGAGAATAGLSFHLNQFALYSNTSRPRGRSRVAGPGMWMLAYEAELGPKNHLSVDVMGSPEPLTVGDKGTPQLLQTDHIDAMHAHDAVMALELRDTVSLGAHGGRRLIVLFAPRGEAAIGPVPFMHRESAEGNPDAPLGHGLQDGFHDASTVMGLAYQAGRTSAEITAFSGQAISRPFPMHRLDSYGLRLIRDIDDHVRVGASYADVLEADDAGALEHDRFVAAWLTTSGHIHADSLKSSSVWAQGRAGHGSALNSFLEEALYQRGRNRLYGRAEILQISPGQLDLSISPASTSARWVEAITLGYERALLETGKVSLFAGGAYTRDFVPADFRPAYGHDPGGVKLYLRVKIDD